MGCASLWSALLLYKMMLWPLDNDIGERNVRNVEMLLCAIASLSPRVRSVAARAEWTRPPHVLLRSNDSLNTINESVHTIQESVNTIIVKHD